MNEKKKEKKKQTQTIQCQKSTLTSGLNDQTQKKQGGGFKA